MVKDIIKKTLSFGANHIAYHWIPKDKKQDISTEDAERILQEYYPDSNTSAIWDNSSVKCEIDLSIIVPVYNVDKYLEKCIDSLINQKTIYSYDIVVVNDCSPDDSAIILKKYEDNEKVKILNHTVNQGVSAARNTGLRHMRGNYVMFVDSDDFVTENAVQDLLNAAYGAQADIVQASYYDVDSTGDKKIGSKKYDYCESVPPNGIISGMPWGKVYKSYLFHTVCFPEKYWYEDTIITALVSHLAKKIVTIPNFVYFYRLNFQGIVRTGKGKPKAIDTFWVHRCVLNAREKLGLKTDKDFYEHLIRMVVLSYKRIETETENVKKSLLVLFREMLLSVRQDDFRLQRRYVNFEKAIINGEYQRCAFLCKTWYD